MLKYVLTLIFMCACARADVVIQTSGAGDTAATAIPYAIVPVNGTGTVSEAGTWIQKLVLTDPCVLNVVPATQATVSQINLSVVAGTNTLVYSTASTNTVAGLSDIAVSTNSTTTILLYSPYNETTWEASEL